MLRIAAVIKEGKRIHSYVCVDNENGKAFVVDKETIVKSLQHQEETKVRVISNARLQVYKGQQLVRYNTDKVESLDIGPVIDKCRKEIADEKAEKIRKNKEAARAAKEKAARNAEKARKKREKVAVKNETVDTSNAIRAAVDGIKILEQFADRMSKESRCETSIVGDTLYIKEWGGWSSASALSTHWEDVERNIIESAIKKLSKHNISIEVNHKPVHLIEVSLTVEDW